MSAKIIKFYPRNAAQNPDAVLEQAAGNFENVFIIGWDNAGNLDVRASTNWSVGEIVMAIEMFKHKLMTGDYDIEGWAK